jgi:hypothetical protein
MTSRSQFLSVLDYCNDIIEEEEEEEELERQKLLQLKKDKLEELERYVTPSKLEELDDQIDLDELNELDEIKDNKELVLRKYYSKYGREVISQYLKYANISIPELINTDSTTLDKGINKMLDQQKFDAQLRQAFLEIEAQHKLNEKMFSSFRKDALEFIDTMLCSEEEKEFHRRSFRD